MQPFALVRQSSAFGPLRPVFLALSHASGEVEVIPFQCRIDVGVRHQATLTSSSDSLAWEVQAAWCQVEPKAPAVMKHNSWCHLHKNQCLIPLCNSKLQVDLHKQWTLSATSQSQPCTHHNNWFAIFSTTCQFYKMLHFHSHQMQVTLSWKTNSTCSHW